MPEAGEIAQPNGAASSASTDTANNTEAVRTLAVRVEALVFAAGEPVAISALAAALEVTPAEVEAALGWLAEQYADRGIRLQQMRNTVRFVTAPELAEAVQRLLGMEGAARLSAAALETLAIIAYLQPITRPQLEMIRGVNCDGVITTLLARNLIQELGRAEGPGHPMRYGVSDEFLNHFGLLSLAELPPLEHLDVVVSQALGADKPGHQPSAA